MKRPAPWATIVLPTLIVCAGLVVGLALAGKFWWSAAFVPSTLVAFVVVRFLWGR